MPGTTKSLHISIYFSYSIFYSFYMLPVLHGAEPTHPDIAALVTPLSALGGRCTTKQANSGFRIKFFEILIKTLIISILVYAREENTPRKLVYTVSAFRLRTS
jgi:hypothetical protein